MTSCQHANVLISAHR